MVGIENEACLLTSLRLGHEQGDHTLETSRANEPRAKGRRSLPAAASGPAGRQQRRLSRKSASSFLSLPGSLGRGGRSAAGHELCEITCLGESKSVFPDQAALLPPGGPACCG